MHHIHLVSPWTMHEENQIKRYPFIVMSTFPWKTCIYSTPAIYRGIKKPLHQPTQHTCRCRKGESVHQPIIVQDILAGCTILRIYISSDTPQSKFASYAYAQDMQRMHERTHSTTSHHGQIHVWMTAFIVSANNTCCLHQCVSILKNGLLRKTD